jgi:hypothetical protein
MPNLVRLLKSIKMMIFVSMTNNNWLFVFKLGHHLSISSDSISALCHSGESPEGIPLRQESSAFASWMPAFAGMTIRLEVCLSQTDSTPINAIN